MVSLVMKIVLGIIAGVDQSVFGAEGVCIGLNELILQRDGIGINTLQ